MLSYPKGSNVDEGYWATIESEYEINGLCFEHKWKFQFLNENFKKDNHGWVDNIHFSTTLITFN